MSNEHKLIEAILEDLKEVHTGLNNDIQTLIEQGYCEEEDLKEIKSTIDKLYKLNIHQQELLVAILSDDYNNKVVKKNLIDLRLINALKRGTDEKSSVEWFVEKYLDKDSKKD